ncbi:MAG: hypothetical protein LBU32_30410 [Clostridiales bacterium]|nr:hypothetical protein [Clostridiales bacterium]
MQQGIQGILTLPPGTASAGIRPASPSVQSSGFFPCPGFAAVASLAINVVFIENVEFVCFFFNGNRNFSSTPEIPYYSKNGANIRLVSRSLPLTDAALKWRPFSSKLFTPFGSYS